MIRSKIPFALFLSTIFLFFASCKQPIDLPDGVQVLVNGQSIEGNVEILVDPGSDVRLQVSGLQGNSSVDVTVRKLGIPIHEETLAVNNEGTVDKNLNLPDIEVQVTVIISYTDWSGAGQEMSFILKLRE